MKLVKRFLKVMLAIIILIGLVSCGKSCYEYVTYRNTLTFELEEIEDGIYGYYTTTVSARPAENYEVITLYFSGRIYTLDGTVKIHYTDYTPKLIWTDTNTVHGDRFDVYAPEGSIVIRPNVNVA